MVSLSDHHGGDALLLQHPKLGGQLSPTERAAVLADEGYWKALCPKLHVVSDELRCQLADQVIDPDPDLVDELRERMARDGYWDVASDSVREDDGEVHLAWAGSVADMAESVALLAAAGWPPSFLLMYDEVWVMAHQLKHFILLTSGNRMIFDFAMV